MEGAVAQSEEPLQLCPAVAPPVVWWLRLEGLAVVVLSAVFYARSGASWWIFAALWLVPDLSFLSYLAGPRWGARCYNICHSYMVPAAIILAALVFHRDDVLPFALLWFNHIGLDRLLGYGLKYPTAFGYTHLKHLGKQRADFELPRSPEKKGRL
jgi:Domain of unknown function (DUF4260)